MYLTVRTLTQPLGNNAFAYYPGRTLKVPSLIEGTLADVRKGVEIVFEEMEWSARISSCGLQQFVKTTWQDTPVYIFDNHNHALAFWCDALSKGNILSGFELVHIDMHSDLWENAEVFDVTRSMDVSYVENFIDEKTNVGNYILPAVRAGLVSRVIRIEGEWDMDRYENENIGKNSVLNLDLDFFAPELDDIEFTKKKACILHFARQVSVITVATSPYFIDQDVAIQKLHQIFS